MESKANKSKSFIHSDPSKLFLLALLYSVQGVAFGFLDIAMPIIFKRHFSYSEVGVISWCFFPLTIKFLFAPFVDTYFFKWLGKKRSWIVPTQLLIAAFNFCLAAFLPELIDQQRYLAITFAFLLIVLLCALQDIAIDGWCLTMVSEDNRDNASLAQTIGIQLGLFLGTSFFYALSSIDFCNTYIYSEIQSEPLLNYSNFFTLWGYYILILAVITLLFTNEKHDSIKLDDHGYKLNDIIYTIKCSLQSKQILLFIMFCFTIKMFSCVNSFVGKMYLLNEIKYNQSRYSFISLFSFPVTLTSSFMIIKFGKSLKILQKLVLISVFRALCDIFIINILYFSLSQSSAFDVLLIILNTFDVATHTSWYIVLAGYSNTVANPIIASTQTTFIHSIGNFGYEFPKLYTYTLVDKFGVFAPNLVGCVLTLGICACLYPKASDPDLYKVMEIGDCDKKDD